MIIELTNTGQTTYWNPPYGITFLGFGTGSSKVSVTIREAIVSFLNNISPLTNIVGSRIYWNVPSQKSNYPTISVQVPDRTWGHNLDGADGTSTATFEITFQHSNPGGHGESTVVAMAEAARNKLDGFRGLMAGVSVLSIFLQEEEDEYTNPPDGSDNWIYRIVHTYRVRHRVPAPTSVTQKNV